MTKPHSFLFVHAHPDDETINNGATMAQLVSQGQDVHVLTCTRGEEGEILVAELADLASNAKDQLGKHRENELKNAMKILGVRNFSFLGGNEIEFRDSGMMGTSANQRPDNFWNCDFEKAVEICAKLICEIKPDVLITYDEFGGYGHPDHIQTHRVAMAAAQKASSEWEIPRIYWNAMPKSLMEEAIEKLKSQGIVIPGMESSEDLGFLVDDGLITTHIDATDFTEQKISAMLAHQTQISKDGEFFQLANTLGNQIFGHEYYVLVKGERGNNLDAKGRESTLFS